ncbi:hypothetical protein MMC18_009660 [Xylographa bjoerkii]|nr:hypothetical protein [Xylographa bjoerkii]
MSLPTVASQTQAFYSLINQYGPTRVASMVHTASQFGAPADLNMTNVRASKQGLADASKTKATRPLNSFIMYRCYYSQIFTGMQQKEISANVTILWKQDPFKGKWEILAKAYSVIRDGSGKQNTPLDKFIAINGPYIGILVSGNYLRTLGWELSFVGDQLKLNRTFEIELASLDEDLLTTNLSVANIISYSIDMGYVSADGNGLSMQTNGTSMIMASSSGQRVHVGTNFFTQHGSSSGTSAIAGGLSAANTTVSSAIAGPSTIRRGTQASGTGNHAVANAVSTTTASTTSAADDAWLAVELQQIVDDEEDEADREEEDAADAVRDDISLMMLSSEFYTLDGEYPFNEEFEPNGPTYDFDPYMGNAFNAYNIADFTEESAFAI